MCYGLFWIGSPNNVFTMDEPCMLFSLRACAYTQPIFFNLRFLHYPIFFGTMPTKNKAFEDAGGINQRRTKAKIAAAIYTTIQARVRPLIDSASVFSWLQKWSWGKMGSIEVQKEAHNSHNDYQKSFRQISSE